MRVCLMWLAGSFLTAVCQAANYYVAVDGKNEHDGSLRRPWPSVAFALSKAGPGRTIIVRPGTYRGPIEIAKQFSGSRDQPTVIQAEVKWKAVILGAEAHAIATADGCDHVIVDGFEVLGARYDGIKMNGDSCVVRNCWVHNNGGMGVAMHEKRDGVIEANLIEFNGCNVQFHHGVYASGARLSVRRNIVRHNSGYGLHLYPELRDSTVSQNLIHGHATQAGVVLACPSGGGRNRIVNNTIVNNAGAVVIWGGDNEIVANNILVANSEVLDFGADTHKVTVMCNLCMPTSSRQALDGPRDNPGFVDAARGVFWLHADSSARGHGAREYAPDDDFWGNPLRKHKRPDLGAFEFYPFLTSDAARTGWRDGWPYRFVAQEKMDMPDLWALPEDQPSPDEN